MDPEIKTVSGNKFINWLKSHKPQLYFYLTLLIVLSVGLGLWYTLASYKSPELENSHLTKAPPKIYSPLTGVEVKDEATTKRRVTAIMIENSPEARPQSGLKQAGVVFEAIAEGGITRFVALYQEARPGLIGPVRSVRPYYVEWAAAFDESMAHIGGSAKALKMIRNGNYGVDLDQFFNDQAYWRASDRYAPHNVYTNFSRLDALNKSKHANSSDFDAFPRKNDPPKLAKKLAAKTINVNFSSSLFNVRYVFDPKTNSYLRYEGGVKHIDREKGQIQPKVVIVIKVKMTLGFEDGYREQIATSGNGQAYVFQDGQVTKGTWKKSSAKSQIKFIDASGQEIKLNRGQTWISAIPSDQTVSWQ